MMIPDFGKGERPDWSPSSVYEVILPNGDNATAHNLDAAMLTVETLIEDVARYLRENVVVKRDGEIDSVATAMAQQAGMLV